MRAAAVLAVLVLAGCASAVKDPAQGSDGNDAFDGIAPSATTGVIKGLVVDEAIRPVKDADIALTPGDQTALTDGGGTFAFADLDPGQYFVLVSKPGYNTTKGSIFVEAAEDPSIFKIQIIRDVTRQPYVEAHKTTILTGAAVCVQDTCQRVILSGTAAGQGANKLSIAMRPGATVGQTEMHWKPTTQFGGNGANFCVSWIPGPGDWVDDQMTKGPMPVVTRVNATMPGANGAIVEATLLECELQGAAGANPPIGILFAQPVDAFTHIFYHFTPREDWQFGRDGDYPVPDV